jgi:hypothetical protein
VHPIGAGPKALERSLLGDAQRLAHLLPGRAVSLTGDEDLSPRQTVRGIRESESCRGHSKVPRGSVIAPGARHDERLDSGGQSACHLRRRLC